VWTVQRNRFAWVVENRFPWFDARGRSRRCDRGCCLPAVDGPTNQESGSRWSYSSQYSGWTGLATLSGQQVMFEVRLLRGKGMILAGQLLAAIAVVVIGAADWQILLPVMLIAMAMVWWPWRMFVREKGIAGQIVAELCRKFQGE